jgi:formate C-acetyltransferase
MSFKHVDNEEEGIDILKSFLRSYVRLGGNILTVTTVETETLKEAQKKPKDYESLRVRLGGLTAYFVQLAKPQQDEYIKRTEHGF